MKTIIQRFKEIRGEEGGFTLAEATTYILLLGMLAALCTIVFPGPINFNRAFTEKTMSVNQGVVGDKVTELYKAAERYRQDFPDRPITKNALTDGGYIVMPASYVWTVGTYGLNSEELCAVTYSTTDQPERYTKENPAEYASGLDMNAQGAPGCWHTDNNNHYVPDWNQEDAFPQGVWYGTN